MPAGAEENQGEGEMLSTRRLRLACDGPQADTLGRKHSSDIMLASRIHFPFSIMPGRPRPAAKRGALANEIFI